MSGQDWSLSNIFKSAKNQYLQQMGQILDEKEFNKAILDNLRIGVAYVRYESFLNEELGRIKTVTDIISSKHNRSLIIRFFSNPWTITVIGGLLIAFLAKTFGWV